MKILNSWCTHILIHRYYRPRYHYLAQLFFYHLAIGQSVQRNFIFFTTSEFNNKKLEITSSVRRYLQIGLSLMTVNGAGMAEGGDERRVMSDITVATIGNVDSGKSTLVGVLTKSILDDGRGYARSKVCL